MKNLGNQFQLATITASFRELMAKMSICRLYPCAPSCLHLPFSPWNTNKTILSMPFFSLLLKNYHSALEILFLSLGLGLPHRKQLWCSPLQGTPSPLIHPGSLTPFTLDL